MQENSSQDLNLFKLNKLPQFPKLPKLDLNNIIGKGNDDNLELQENNSKYGQKENYETQFQSNSTGNTIVFELGSSISKKKCVEVLKDKDEKGSRNNQMSDEKIKVFFDERTENSSIFNIQEIYDDTLSIYKENIQLRDDLKNEISNIMNEIKNYKENILDYWIELTLTQK